MDDRSGEVTRLLAEASAGRREAWDQIAPLVYEELMAVAEGAMRRERRDHTLQPTALVHEAFVRLVGQNAGWMDRSHFFSAAAVTMRRVLVDHARRRNAAKRAGGRSSEPMDAALVSFESRSADILDLDDALTRLEQLAPEQARIIELRFFGGLTVEETAGTLGVSVTTVERGWRTARAFLLREVSG